MQIKLGEKIKELRRRDGRKQEELAQALGVTGQAVSRWESGSCYPDMETVPAIANYFGVTIDELFGYRGDREEKIKDVLAKAETDMEKQVDLTDCIAMLRAAAQEYPLEARIFLKLGFALDMLGWQKYGARAYTKDGSDYVFEDIAYNAENSYWQEELQVFERLLPLELSVKDKETVILHMIALYAKMGMPEKAETLASGQTSVSVSRECLLPYAKTEEDKDTALGEAILALLDELKKAVENAVSAKISLCSTEKGISILLSLIRMMESVFDDGNCGTFHISLSELYLYCAIYKSRLGNSEKAMEYFDAGYRHYRKYKAIRNTGEYHYSAPLVEKVSFSTEKLPDTGMNFWAGWIFVFPEDFREQIRQNPAYADCFPLLDAESL